MARTDVIKIMKLLGEMGYVSMITHDPASSEFPFHVLIDNELHDTDSPVDVIWDFWHEKKVGE